VNPAGGIFLRVFGSGRADLEIRIPPVNVLGLNELGELAARVGEIGSVRLLVLTGWPHAFSAGVSVSDHEPEPEAIGRMLRAMRQALSALVDAPAVTLAAVAGACLGGGAEIAAACDLVLVAEDARIGFPEIRLACFPPAAVALLPPRIGEARRNEWILTGRIFSGREAGEAGFASRVVDAAALPHETDRLAEELLARSPAALAAARDLLRAGRREALARVLPQAEAAYRNLSGDPALREAVREFGRSKV
jgi:cyclohexa-1,5-dienecarbonyl-CoA hydratase